MAQSDFYGGDKRAYINEVINPMYYPEGQAVTLTEKHVKMWLSPFLEYVEEGKQNYSPQLWGESAYAIVVNDYIDNYSSLSDVLAAIRTNKEGATNFLDRLNIARTYSTYCPAIIGYDPVNDGYFRSMAVGIGGTLSYSSNVRDSSFMPFSNPAEIRYFLYFNENTSTVALGYDAAGNEDSTDSTKTAYSVGGSPNWFNSFETRLTEGLSNLKIYLVIRNNNPNGSPPHYVLNWLIVSIENDYFHLSSDYLVCYGVPTDEGEGDEPEMIDYPEDGDSMGVNSGLLRVYKMGYNDVQNLAADMWDDTFLSQIGHLFGDNPNYGEAIISLGILPYPDRIEAGAATAIRIGKTSTPTAVGLPVVKRTYHADFAGVSVGQPHGGSFLDYAPYTSITAYLPFIGFVSLEPKFIIGHTVQARYIVDVITGGCMCFLKNESVGVFAVHAGNTMYSIPISQTTGGNWYNAVQSAVSAGVSLAATSHITTTKTDKISLDKTDTKRANGGGLGVMGIGNIITTAQHAFDTTTQMRGGIGGTNGFNGWVNSIEIWVSTPIRADTGDYISTKGVPICQYLALDDCTGFTQVESINLHGLAATRGESEELETILKTGFYTPKLGSVTQPTTTSPTSGYCTIDCYSRTAGISELNYSGCCSAISVPHTGAFRKGDTPSITDPAIIVGVSALSLKNCNYVHIAEFDRFYFVTGIIALTSETTLLLLHVDVLNSFWDSIKNISAYIGRMDDENNTVSSPYIADDCAILESSRGNSDNDVITYSLTYTPATPNTHGCYILLTNSD